MIIGIPKEIKKHEYRVGATPEMIKLFVAAGHTVYVETGAAEQIGFTNVMYQEAGATIVNSAKEVYSAEMVIKVKEPQESEFPLMHEGQIIFGYFHLAPDLAQTEELLKRKVIAIAYETVVDSRGQLPLLIPMSEIAGRISIQVGATLLQLNEGGKGILLGGVAGVAPAKVTIIGGGAAGTEAARMAMGLGAQVVVLDRNIHRLRELDALFGPRLLTIYSTSTSIESSVISSDLVIGSVLVPGKMAPKLITKAMISKMEPRSVFIDIAIDQGGCSETSKPTSHSHPTYVVEGVTHYCVTNMPGACARTATLALTHATLPYALAIANKGYKQALKENSGLLHGLNLCLGKVTYEAVAQDLNLKYTPALSMIS